MAGEPPAPLVVNTDSSGASAWVIGYRDLGGGLTLPATAGTGATGTAGETSSVTVDPDITTFVSDARVISLVAVRDGNILALDAAGDQGFIQHANDVQSTTGHPRAIGLADTVVATPGAVPMPTWSQGGTPAQWAWISLTLG